ncbi:MAG: nucleoside-diphosphate kinase [Flavobacteriales bacterium]
MRGTKTFAMIKPDAVEEGHIGDILQSVTAAGFKISALEMAQMTRIQAQRFYAIHRERPFFTDLVAFVTRGPIVAAILEKENAVADFRALIGATNPDEAVAGTIRKRYAKSVEENAIHGSDSDENARIEIDFHFAGKSQF